MCLHSYISVLYKSTKLQFAFNKIHCNFIGICNTFFGVTQFLQPVIKWGNELENQLTIFSNIYINNLVWNSVSY